MMYKCICGAVFEDPLVITERNYCGEGHWERLKMVLCPECQGAHFDEYEEEDE